MSWLPQGPSFHAIGAATPPIGCCNAKSTPWALFQCCSLKACRINSSLYFLCRKSFFNIYMSVCVNLSTKLICVKNKQIWLIKNSYKASIGRDVGRLGSSRIRYIPIREESCKGLVHLLTPLAIKSSCHFYTEKWVNDYTLCHILKLHLSSLCIWSVFFFDKTYVCDPLAKKKKETSIWSIK